jgi:hypothetical protein
MAISTYGVYLMHKVASAYKAMIDIKDYPDLGGPPDMIETTTLSDPAQTYIPGIESVSALEFTCNYDKTKYETLKTYEGIEDKEFAVYFGETGTNGKFLFKGQMVVYPPGAGVNDVAEMIIVIAPSTAIEKET